MSYESPISLIFDDATTEINGNIMRVVQGYHVDVNQKELIKALNYDRNQYQAGWQDAIRSYARPAGIWVFKEYDDETGIANSYFCSECGKPQAQVYKNYCANCGAKF